VLARCARTRIARLPLAPTQSASGDDAVDAHSLVEETPGKARRVDRKEACSAAPQRSHLRIPAPLLPAVSVMASKDATTAVLSLVRLAPVMRLSSGSRALGIGLVDGPVVVDHPDFAGANIRSVGADQTGCAWAGSAACIHGTFVAGILVARRGSAAPAICPECTLVVRPIFRETGPDEKLPTASPDEVGQAIVECVDAGARVVNLSAATGQPTTQAEGALRRVLDYAARRGALIVAAAGNQGTLGSSEITRHPGVIPVVAFDLSGRPMTQSNVGSSIGRWGVGAPGDEIVSLAPERRPAPRAGTSLAAAIVTGAIALLWSLFPSADPGRLRRALTPGGQRRSVIPPLMDVQHAYEVLSGEEAPRGRINSGLTFRPRRA
jgi:subtilisin family serine protease